MAAKEKKQKKKGKEGKGGSKLRAGMIYFVCLVLMVVLKGWFIFLLVSMLPSIVARIADTSQGKEFYRCVVACNIAGVLPHVLSVFSVSSDEAMKLLANPTMWLSIYSLAGIGWIIVGVTPAIAEILTQFNHNSRVSRLEDMQKKLVEEWGPEIQRKPQ